MKRPKAKIGLALGSGAARGMAHVGVLEVIEKEKIPVDMIAGTSAGAAVGALYAQGLRAADIHQLASELGKKSLSLVDPSLPVTGFLKGRKIKELLKSSLGGELQFRDLSTPFTCLATDIMTGEEVVLNSGSVVDAVRASISIPIIFAAVKLNGRYLVDGGLVNPVPVSILRKMGADFIIAVNVIPDTIRKVDESKRRKSKEPNIFNIIMQSIYIGTYSLARSCMEGANIIIEPNVKSFSPGDFRRAEELIYQGQLAASQALPEIISKLKLRGAKRND